MQKPTYTKLDANLNPLPADHPNEGADKHLLVRVTHPMMVGEVIVSAYRIAADKNFAGAKKLCEAHTIHGKPCRGMSVEEAFFIPDRTRTDERLDPNFFPDAEGWEYSWTVDVDSESPSVYAWLVNLGYGYCYRGSQSDRYHVRPVLAGQS